MCREHQVLKQRSLPEVGRQCRGPGLRTSSTSLASPALTGSGSDGVKLSLLAPQQQEGWASTANLKQATHGGPPGLREACGWTVWAISIFRGR